MNSSLWVFPRAPAFFFEVVTLTNPEQIQNSSRVDRSSNQPLSFSNPYIMSAIVESQAEGTKPVSRRIRKRPSGGARRRGRGKAAAEKTEGGAEAVPRERKERPESVPVPPAFVGQNMVGVVSAIIRKGRVKFGFIHICPGPEIDESAPRIYFSFAQLADSAIIVRRGYQVSFLVSADEQERAFADNVALTEEGKKTAEAKEAEIAARKSERPATTEDSERPKRAPRERKVAEERPVALTVTCEGRSEAKTITFNFAQSVGKLKNVATTEFDAPVEYNVFHVNAENPEGVFLTKAILLTLNPGDKIHLAAPKDTTA